MTQPIKDYQKESAEIVEKAISEIVNQLNGGNPRLIAEVIYDRITREHRTLQQAFWSALLLAQIKYADNSYHDLRNEAAVKLAKLVRDAARENNLDVGLPYV